MKKETNPFAAALRQKAEAMLKNRKDKAHFVSEKTTKPDPLKLIHELEVHQIELELQNEELLLAKQQAKLAAEKHTSLYDFAPSGYFTLSSEGEIMELNLAGARMLGRERSHLVNSSFGFFVSNESKPVFSRFLDEAFSGTACATCEVALTANGGNPVVVLLTGTRDKSGERCLVMAVDITGRKVAEENLFRIEQNSRAWLENSPVCTKIVDLDFNLKYMSYAGIQGLQIDDITPYYGKPYPFHFYPESFKTEMTANMIRAKETGKVITQEAPAVDINGHEVWYHSTIIPVKDHNERVDYLLIVSLDTTEGRQAEEKLIASEKNFRQIAENINEVFWISAPDWSKFYYISPAYYDVWGEEAEKLKEQPFLWIDSIIEEDKEKVRSCITETITKDIKEIIFPDYRIKKSDGAIIWISARAYPIFDSEGNPHRIAGIAEDITERKLTEEEIRKNMDEMHRFHRLTVGRELKMIELKNEVNELCRQLGLDERHKIVG